MRVLVATMNRDKTDEISALLAGTGLEVLCLADLDGATAPEETGATLEENALLKARAAREASGLTALADDTGLEVDALGGAPGVRSSRFAGAGASYEDNCRLLLERLEGVPTEGRGARGGFGYDPVFEPLGSDRTYAEMTLQEKNRTSHRAVAVRRAAEDLLGRMRREA